ncbi:MAG: hypothetical protein ACI3XG_07040 [Faecousia sp.]
MKFNTIVKIVTALAAAVGAVYIVATFGDKIVAWAKGIMGGCCPEHVVDVPAAPKVPAEEAAPAEEPAQEEVPAAEEAAQEPAAEEAAPEAVLADDAIPVADEEDFEG